MDTHRVLMPAPEVLRTFLGTCVPSYRIMVKGDSPGGYRMWMGDVTVPCLLAHPHSMQGHQEFHESFCI